MCETTIATTSNCRRHDQPSQRWGLAVGCLIISLSLSQSGQALDQTQTAPLAHPSAHTSSANSSLGSLTLAAGTATLAVPNTWPMGPSILSQLQKIPGLRRLTQGIPSKYWLSVIAAAWGSHTLYQWWQHHGSTQLTLRSLNLANLVPSHHQDHRTYDDAIHQAELHEAVLHPHKSGSSSEPPPGEDPPQVPPFYELHDQHAYQQPPTLATAADERSIISSVLDEPLSPSLLSPSLAPARLAEHSYFQQRPPRQLLATWHQDMAMKYQQMSHHHHLYLARTFHIPIEHLSEFIQAILLHRHHLSYSPHLLAIHSAFVLQLADESMSQLSTKLNLDHHKIRRLTHQLHDELIIYTQEIPKTFHDPQQLAAYQAKVVRILAQFEESFFKDHRNVLTPLRHPYLAELASHKLQAPFQTTPETILFNAHHLAIPTIPHEQLLELLPFSAEEAEQLMHHHRGVASYLRTKPMGTYHPQALEKHYFHLNYAQIQDLHTDFYDLLHLETSTHVAFYHQLKAFYQQKLTTELQRQLFLTCVLKLIQPSVLTMRQLAHHFHLNITTTHHQDAISELDTTTDRLLKQELSLVVTELKAWFHNPNQPIHLSFDSASALGEYLHHRMNELTERDLTTLAELWGLQTAQQRTFPMQLQIFQKTHLNHPLKFNIFGAYILHWNPLPLQMFADLHDITPDQLKKLIRQLFEQFQTALSGAETAATSLHKILEDLYLQFTQLNDDELTELINTQGFHELNPLMFTSLVARYLETAGMSTHRTILFLAKVLQLSPLSHLEWDHIFAAYPATQNSSSSLIVHLHIDQHFRAFLAENHPH